MNKLAFILSLVALVVAGESLHQTHQLQQTLYANVPPPLPPADSLPGAPPPDTPPPMAAKPQ